MGYQENDGKEKVTWERITADDGVLSSEQAIRRQAWEHGMTFPRGPQNFTGDVSSWELICRDKTDHG